MVNKTNNELKEILNYLVKTKVFTKEKAYKVWNLWRKKQIDCLPSQFLLKNGVSLSILKNFLENKKKITPSLKSTVIEKEKDRENITKKKLVDQNNKLALHLKKEKLIPADKINEILKICNNKNYNLGQTLVKKHYIKMSDLTQLMK